MNQETCKNVSFFRFEDLRVYNKALDFANSISSFSKKNSSDFAASELCRTASAIAVHIAEGSSSDKSLFIENLKKAKVDVRKSIVYLSLAEMSGCMDKSEQEDYRTQLMELTKMIGALITSLQKNNGQQATQQDYDIDGLTW